ncbi:neurotensin receptor type 2 isoform X2 [Cebus imitator]|uniref:neurotensin receptor type 2 isoform X2 n=1 Tax=Cebus imitator TaxID=2715852 RepID=UPI00189B6407|nr:neurotensin receptor type 2 isoform X2 [Cebus imitator]
METSSPRPPQPSPNPGLSLDARLGVDTRLWAKVLFTALYALIWALGAAGNALSVHVVLKARAGRAGRLRYHVLSLALSGLLLLLVGVPVELYSFVWFHYPWVFGDLGCRGYYFVRELCAYATVLSVASLSAERCLAVCQPLRARSLLTPRRTRRLVALLWVVSLGLALPMAVIMGQKHELETASGEPELASRVCTVLVSRTALQVFIQVNVLVSFVLPLALTAFLNGVTVNHLLALCSQVPSTSALGSSTPSRLELLSEDGLLSFIVWKKTFFQGGQVSLVRHKDPTLQFLPLLLHGDQHTFLRQLSCDSSPLQRCVLLLQKTLPESPQLPVWRAPPQGEVNHPKPQGPTLIDTASGFGDPPKTPTGM